VAIRSSGVSLRDEAGEVSKIGVAYPTSSLEALVDAALDTLVTALYVKIDDGLAEDRRPGHPVRLSQSELVCLAVAQALLGFHSEHRWIRFAICHLRGCFPYLPHQPGYNKRLRAALPLIRQAVRDLAADSDFWFDSVWIADSTPVECGRSRPTVRRPDLAGWANYGTLRLAFALVLGAAAVPDLHPGRDAGLVGAGRPEDRRAGSADRDARRRARPGHRPARPDPDHRQGVRRPAHRG
jgi:hypothetical protein